MYLLYFIIYKIRYYYHFLHNLIIFFDKYGLENIKNYFLLDKYFYNYYLIIKTYENMYFCIYIYK